VAQKKKKATTSSDRKELVLAEAKLSRYRIIIPSSPTPEEVHAADVLQAHLLKSPALLFRYFAQISRVHDMRLYWVKMNAWTT
jgi:hypothetical protein